MSKCVSSFVELLDAVEVGVGVVDDNNEDVDDEDGVGMDNENTFWLFVFPPMNEKVVGLLLFVDEVVDEDDEDDVG